MPRGFGTHFALRRLKRKLRNPKRRGYQKIDHTGVVMPVLDQDLQPTWGHPLDVQASDVLPHLNAAERNLFKVVVGGDVQKLHAFLQENPSININCQDYKGQTPLVIAIKHNDEEMVDYIMHLADVIIGEAIFHAVQVGNIYVVEMLLNGMRGTGRELSRPAFVASAEFCSDITPLILAAQCENYQVVKLLLQRGHVIKYPHPPECFCKQRCSWKVMGETLSDSRARYHSYQAMASPAYICQSSTDPILTAFVLSRELHSSSRWEMELKNEYRNLSKDVSQLAVDLLQQCRTTEEVELVLGQTAAPRGHEPPDGLRFPRVAFAIECKQKKFIAHPNAQHVMRQAWLGDSQRWRTLSNFGMIKHILPNFFLLPCMAFVYIVAPKNKLVKSWKSPINKFISYTVSYIIFLIILYTHNELDSHSYVRGPPDTGLEVVVIIYVTSFCWVHIKRCTKQGPKTFFRQNWHIYDLVQLILFYASFASWAWAWYDVATYGHKYVPRRYWNEYDPSLVSEAIYAIATIVAFGKLLFFFQIGNRLGPLQVSMSSMFKDIFDFLLVFIIVLVSFATGIHKLYNYYRGQVLHVHGKEKEQSPAFLTFSATVNNLFWSLFGYSPPAYADVIVSEQVYRIHNKTIVYVNKHNFTEATGYMLYSIYNVAAIIILLNLLIAMMSTSFILVQENADEEWKFARTTVWMMFFEDGSTLPPPFNIIPTPKTIWRKLYWVWLKLHNDPTAKCSKQNCCYIDDEHPREYTTEEYEVLMGRLVQRYLRYSTQMQLREQHLTDSDRQYLLHGIPPAHLMMPRLHTSSSSSSSSHYQFPSPTSFTSTPSTSTLRRDASSHLQTI